MNLSLRHIIIPVLLLLVTGALILGGIHWLNATRDSLHTQLSQQHQQLANL